jgi:hypothetical protein
MDDAATTWVSPFCQVYPGPVGQAPGVLVWVLNPGAPGAGEAEVTVRIYDVVSAALLGAETKTVKPRHSEIFTPASPSLGWCQVQSDKPVVPWGLTGWENGDQQGVIDMTFYRHEPVPRVIQGLEGALASALRSVSRGTKPPQSAEA